MCSQQSSLHNYCYHDCRLLADACPVFTNESIDRWHLIPVAELSIELDAQRSKFIDYYTCITIFQSVHVISLFLASVSSLLLLQLLVQQNHLQKTQTINRKILDHMLIRSDWKVRVLARKLISLKGQLSFFLFFTSCLYFVFWCELLSFDSVNDAIKTRFK